eukprot:CAMPEP_0176146706 /NCGR_PEP_ID=MMETSP0120_2-20121206/74767_1 /TAXON_ID=160619 /ORGANISM="Kryptoperidinium foliaceum, Strain CCMP 1326" /LENGTH=141 /DNA_ID=CAMNT_0017483267 /DNA_START=14 /DNA_END=437 /DNA_ORIENTATION=-
MSDSDDEAHRAEQSTLTSSIERLLREFQGLDASGATGDAWEQHLVFARKAAVSTELLDSCQALQQIIEEAQEHQQKSLAARSEALRAVSSEAAQRAGQLGGGGQRMAEQQELQQKLQESHNEVQRQLQEFDGCRSEVERDI